MSDSTTALAVTVDEAARTIKISRPSIYVELNSGRLRSFTLGRRRLISVKALQEWIAAREHETLTPKSARSKRVPTHAAI